MISLPFLNMSGSAAVAGRAVVEKEKNDIQARDHASLGTSLHQVGCCFLNTGDFDAARRWFERAVEEKEKGTSTAGSITPASAQTCTRWVTACSTSATLLPPASGTSAPLRKPRRATFTCLPQLLAQKPLQARPAAPRHALGARGRA
jgi:hypothetical protein